MKKLFLFLLVSCAFVESYGQEKYFYVNYDIPTPLSNTDWIGSSGKGLRIGYRKFINPKFSAGVDVGYNTFDEYFPKTTFVFSNGAVTTDGFNYVTAYEIAASGQYNFNLKSKIFHPYAGIGLGAKSNQYKQFYNIYSESERNWGFLARPEVGMLFRISERRSLGAMLSVYYSYATNKTDSYGYDNFSTFGVTVGIISMDW